MLLLPRGVRLICAILGIALTGSACAPRLQSGPSRHDTLAPLSEPASRELDPTVAYRRAGLIVQGPPLPFVGKIGYLAARTPDSTLVLFTLSLANRSLTFIGDGPTQRAAYDVMLVLWHGSSPPRYVETRETVRINSAMETRRTDESIVFQRFFAAPPGDYTLSITVRDAAGSNTAVQETHITIPRLTTPALSSPIPVYEATSRSELDSFPRLIANPRATILFGRDSLVPLYLEGYGLPPDARVAIGVRDEQHRLTFSDTITLALRGSLSASVVRLPTVQLGVGQLDVVAPIVGSSDTVNAPLLVSFGEQLGIMTFDQLLNYLRYYATPDRLQALRDSSPAQRALAWAAFLKATDSLSATATIAEHEGLRTYFARIDSANRRFQDEGDPGWLTDRGKVYITLGDPDRILEQGDASIGNHAQIWGYTRYHTQFVFIDQTGFGRWRLTPASEADFELIANRERVH